MRASTAGAIGPGGGGGGGGPPPPRPAGPGTVRFPWGVDRRCRSAYAFSILTAHTLNSAVLVTGSAAALVSWFTGDSS
jgi:hypothetical protein